jgi:N6-L-threonylcarbamoyladenine synthase
LSKYIRVLGIESSCDDTAVAIVDSKGCILSSIIISQKNEHEIFQGVVPEIAARSHMKNLKKAMEVALSESNLNIKELDVISATCGPGLIGGVIVGAMFAKAISSVLKKPFIAVNHLEGHALTARLTNQIDYPYLLLLASGGHCQYVAVLDLGKYKILGQTLDDAIGEAFDKVAKMMNLGFPGGPEIEKKAMLGDKNRFVFPLPMIDRKNCDMSFSGLKTAARLTIEKLGTLSEQDICDVAASFQKAVSNIIYKKTKYAINEYEKIASGKTLVVAGGVAANGVLRSTLELVAQEYLYNFVAPPIKLCTDNAAMIAFAGLERFNAGIISDVSFKPRARWSLEDL